MLRQYHKSKQFATHDLHKIHTFGHPDPVYGLPRSLFLAVAHPCHDVPVVTDAWNIGSPSSLPAVSGYGDGAGHIRGFLLAPQSYGLSLTVLPLDEAIASRAVFVIVSGSDGNAFGAS